MIQSIQRYTACLFTVAAAFAMTAPSSFAEERPWSVAKASGEVWVASPGVVQASLGDAKILKSGDEIRTGRNGRVLLTRGDETILISPNSVVSVPEHKQTTFDTVIIQRAGEIVLQVEKRNAPHFEVETPYLAALVKGTQFRVTVDGSGSRVDVIEGKVQVTDFKSGQFALVLPGQTASALPKGNGGLSIGGAGLRQPVQQGPARDTSVTRVPVPKNGLEAPESNYGTVVRQVKAAETGVPKTADSKASSVPGKTGLIRISAPLGTVSLDLETSTRGFARSASAPLSKGNPSKSSATVWATDALQDGNGVSKSYGQGNKGNGANSSASSGSGNNGNGNGNGNGGNSAVAQAAAANNGNGNNGKGKAYGRNK